MGILDGFLNFDDPQSMSMLGLASGIANAARPSRLPVPLGAAMAEGYGNALQFRQTAMQQQLLNQELMQKQLANRLLLGQMQLAGMDFGDGSPSQSAGGMLSGNPTLGPLNGGAPQDAIPQTGAAMPSAATGAQTGIPMPSPSTAMGLRLPAGMSAQDFWRLKLFDPAAASKIIAAQYPGPTDAERALSALGESPRTPFGKLVLSEAAAKTAGLNPINVRQGGAVYNPLTGQMMFQNPKLPEGAVLANNGQSVATLPGALGSIQGASRAEASGPAAFRPVDITTPEGQPLIAPATILGGGAVGGQSRAPIQQQTTAPLGQGVPLKNANGQMAFPTPQQVQSLQGPIAPSTPVQQSGDIGLPRSLDEVLGPNFAPPSRAAAPAGTFFGGVTEQNKETQKLDAERLGSYQKEAAGGQKIYTNLQQMYQILQRGLSTGNLTEASTHLANTAQQMGLGSLVPKGFNPNDAGAYNKLATDMIFASLKQLPGQPRVAEIEGLKQSNPSLSMTPAANAEILNNILAEQRWKDARSNLGTQYAARYPGTLGTFDAMFNAKFPQVDAYNALTDQAEKAGWKLPGSAEASQGKAFVAHPSITQENIAHTAKLRGVSEEVIKAELRAKGYKVP